jgi:phosphopentomutase
VLRVVARPFLGEPGNFRRAGRRDFSLPPTEETVLDALQKLGHPVLGIGKIADLFCGRGLDGTWRTAGNREGMEMLSRSIGEWPRGLVVANFLDFDTLYGHRNNAAGFAEALEHFDAYLGKELLPSLDKRDLLVLTADHGCDPTMESTDHSREYVPLLVASPALQRRVSLGSRESFCDVAATACDALTGEKWRRGRSFLPDLAEV